MRPCCLGAGLRTVGDQLILDSLADFWLGGEDSELFEGEMWAAIDLKVGFAGPGAGLGWAGLGDSSCHQIQEIGQENKKYFPIHLAGYFKQL